LLRESQEARLAWLKGTDASGKGDEGKKKRGCNLNGYNPIMGLAPIFYKKRSFLPEPPFLQKISHCHCEGAKRLKQSHRYSGIQRLPRSPRSLAMTNYYAISWKRGTAGDFSGLSLREGRKADAAICAPVFFSLHFSFPVNQLFDQRITAVHRKLFRIFFCLTYRSKKTSR